MGPAGPTGPAGGPTGPTGLGATGPTGPTGLGTTGPTGPGTFPGLIAAATVNSTGTFVAQTGFSASTHPATGQYTLTMITTPVSLINIIPTAMVAGGAGGQISYLFTAPNVIDIFTFNALGVAADIVFSIVVFDLEV